MKKNLPRPVIDRFWEKVSKGAPDECWSWMGTMKPNGYGVMVVHDEDRWRFKYAHRLAYTLLVGPIGAGFYVCHKCDNRRCVNPNHLWVGTHQENQQDMGRKGRTFSPCKKLTSSQVEQIRSLKGTALQREVAAQFGVARTYVSRIWSGARRAGK